MDRAKSIFISATIVLVLVTLLNSCHKYPDDPFISLRKPENRLAGSWTITSYQINGTEHLHDFDSILSPETLNGLELEFVPANKTGPGIYRLKSRVGYHTLFTDGAVYFSKAQNVITLSTIGGLLVEKLWDMPKVNANQWTHADWGIKELYKSNCHLKRNNIDIYLKK